MKEQDYKTTALSRLTDRHRSDEAFLAILDTLVEIKSQRQQQYLDIADTFLDIDKSEGKNLDLIGKLIGEERTLVNFIDRSYFGFLGARLSESYDIGYWYSLYKNKYGTLRTLTDEEYRRVLKARVIKNSSDSSRDSFLEVLNVLADNKSSVVVEGINNTAIEVRIKDEDGLVSYYLSKYKNDNNLIPIPLGRRLGVVQLLPTYYSSVTYPYLLSESLDLSLAVEETSSRPDPVLVSVKIPTNEPIDTRLILHDVIIDRPPKINVDEKLDVSLSISDVVMRDLLKTNLDEKLDVSLSISDVVMRDLLKTNLDEKLDVSLSISDVISVPPINTFVDEAINASLSINDTLQEKI